MFLQKTLASSDNENRVQRIDEIIELKAEFLYGFIRLFRQFAVLNNPKSIERVKCRVVSRF